jgi:hypothetical protein
MTKKIFKYSLKVTDYQEISLPKGYEILTIDVQFDNPYIWVLVDPNSPTMDVTFEIFGTGHPIHENKHRSFVGSFQIGDGNLVFHCFVLEPQKMKPETVLSYGLVFDDAHGQWITIDATMYDEKDGNKPVKWAIRKGGLVFSKITGTFEYEPMPSSRDDNFFAEFRFDTPDEAARVWEAFLVIT